MAQTYKSFKSAVTVENKMQCCHCGLDEVEIDPHHPLHMQFCDICQAQPQAYCVVCNINFPHTATGEKPMFCGPLCEAQIEDKVWLKKAMLEKPKPYVHEPEWHPLSGDDMAARFFELPWTGCTNDREEITRWHWLGFESWVWWRPDGKLQEIRRGDLNWHEILADPMDGINVFEDLDDWGHYVVDVGSARYYAMEREEMCMCCKEKKATYGGSITMGTPNKDTPRCTECGFAAFQKGE